MKINAINTFSYNAKLNSKNNISKNIMNSHLNNVSFSSRDNNESIIDVTPEKARYVANSLSTSTSGHRAPYESENFNPEIVKLITLGVAKYAKEKSKNSNSIPYVLIGGDTRRATRESLPLISDVLTEQGIEVINLKEPVPTPVLAVAAQNFPIDLAVLMTASHNPWNDGGYNLVTTAGAIAPASVTKQVAKYMTDIADRGYYEKSFERGSVIDYEPYNMYSKALDALELIDWERIKNSGLTAYYDGLHGSGTYVMPKLMKSHGIPFHEIVSSGQTGPNPTDENLGMLKKAIASTNSGLKIGIANDGDADRFGVVDEHGNFINANDVILLTGYHLAENKNKTGATIRSQATSMQLDALADKYGLQKMETPVGFKYIAEDIIDLRKNGSDILVAGEESGGLTVNKHIPEKDGIIALALMMDLVAREGKPISKILSDVKEGLPVKYSINNYSKRMTDDAAKNAIMERVENLYQRAMTGDVQFGENHEIDAEKTAAVRASMERYKKGGDGVKFILTDGSSVLIRKSGTEPLVKCYIEAVGISQAAANANSQALRNYMNKFLG